MRAATLTLEPSVAAAAGGPRWFSRESEQGVGREVLPRLHAGVDRRHGRAHDDRGRQALGRSRRSTSRCSRSWRRWSWFRRWSATSASLGRPWWRTYWCKLNVWIGIYAGVGSYFGSEYFFDVLGMVYNYPQLAWRLDSVLLGSGDADGAVHHVSVGALLLRHLPHASASSCCAGCGPRGSFGHAWLWPLVVLAAAYGFAWAETFAMTGGAIAEQFTYRDLPRMLRWGSLFYATYFVVSFPMIYRLDESPGDDWPLRRVAVEALAAGMLLLFLLDALTHFVGRLY